jgi:hypothetical protein
MHGAILIQPPQIGNDFETSKDAVKRFKPQNTRITRKN